MRKEIVKKIISKTIANYSKIAADFDRTRSKYAWPIMQEFASYVNPYIKDSRDRISLGTKNFGAGVKSGDAVLDFGCGNGRLLDVLKAENIVYKGVDPVKELIDIARQKYQDVTLFDQSARGLAAKTKRSIEFKVINFDVDDFKLDFPDKYFDHIFSIAVFHHIPSVQLRKDILKEFKRILKDDGRIFLTTWNLWKQKRLRLLSGFLLNRFSDKMIDEVLLKDLDFGDLFISYTTGDRETTVQRYHHAFTKKELRLLAQSVGLNAEKIFYDEKKFNLCATLKKNHELRIMN